MFEFFRGVVGIAVPVFVIATMLNVGLTQKPSAIMSYLRNWPFVLKLLVANFVAVPLVMILILRVTAFEPPSRLAYKLLSGLPVVDYVANVTLAPLPSGGTRIVWSSTFDGRWPLQGRIIAFGLGRLFPDVVRRLADAAAA